MTTKCRGNKLNVDSTLKKMSVQNVPFSNPFWVKPTGLPAFQRNDSPGALVPLPPSPVKIESMLPAELFWYRLLSLESDTISTKSSLCSDPLCGAARKRGALSVQDSRFHTAATSMAPLFFSYILDF
jgi:hypothetical protein